MIGVLAAAAVVLGLLAAGVLRRVPHAALGTAAVAAAVAALAVLPSAAGEYWLVMMSLLTAVAVSVFGVGMLAWRSHTRRMHRHVVYCGYGPVLCAGAVSWALAAARPAPLGTVAALAATAGVYVVGSVGLAAYKRARLRSRGERRPAGPSGRPSER